MVTQNPPPAGARPHDPDGVTVLTHRQRTILELSSNGLTAAAIARRVHLAPSTVKNELGRIYQRLGAANRTEAVVAAWRLGLVTPGRSSEPPLPGGVTTSPHDDEWGPLPVPRP